MNSTAYGFLTLALLINNSISSQIGHDKKVKMNVMLNTTEDGLMKASLYITNATSTMLNNASLIVSIEALLAENNTVIGAQGNAHSGINDSRVNSSVNFSSFEEMENVQKLNRCQTLKDIEVKELLLAIQEITKKLSFQEAELQTFSIFKSKVEEEVEKVQLANVEMRRNLSSQEDEIQELRSLISKVFLQQKGYEYIEGLGYYKYHSNIADFENAVRICENEGTHLGVIDSEKEATEFGKLMWKNGYDFGIWVGIHDPQKNRSFQSILGNPLNALGYKKWRSGEPDNSGGNQYCVVFHAVYGFDDRSCGSQFPFICEIEI